MDIKDLLSLVVIPLITFLAIPLVIPLCIAFKLFSFIKRSLCEEDVRGKVVLITGAASGIGEQIAYEYAKRGAHLCLVGRRREGLDRVAVTAYRLGSPEVIKIGADVSNINDSNRFIQQTLDHFGRLDHLVNNAGIAILDLFDHLPDTSDYLRLMDVNFWGCIHGTRFALPHLKKTKGKIVVIASAAGLYPIPRFCFYGASKAAVISFFETLRTEVGDSVSITITTPGFVRSAMTEPFESIIRSFPMESTERVAKAIVRSACRGDMYLTMPCWMRVFSIWKAMCPKLFHYCTRKLWQI